MEVILLEKIRNLGDLGDAVAVKPGFARNFLIPQGKAVPATAENKASFEARRAELEKSAQEALSQAQERSQKLDGITIQIERRASEDGKLFGSVNTADIADAAVAAGFELNKSEINLSEGPLKVVGDHEVGVTLHPEVSAHVIVSVVAESA
jgi:large subunit ribosomal protein L9